MKIKEELIEELMSNSRSQTKIRKTQQVNLLAEQRYFRQKNLLFENIE